MAVQISIARNRTKLPERREPYWQATKRGRAIGVRKLSGSEYWVARASVGSKYLHRALTEARDWDSALKDANRFFHHIDSGGINNLDTVHELFDMYVETVKSSPTHNTLKKTLEPELGAVKLADVRAGHVKRWRQSAALLTSSNGKQRSAATINRMVSVLRAALNYGLKQQMLIDTSWRVQLRRCKEEGNSRELYLSADDRRKLIQHAAEDAQSFIRLLSLLPLRPGDWSAAVVEDFDTRSSTLFVSSKDHPRHVPLSGAARDLLRRQSKNKLPTALLFVRADGRAWDRQAWNSAIKDAAKRAELTTGISAYTLRHSVISDLCTGGLDIHTTAKLSGTSVAMIEQHYGKLLPHIAVGALDRIAI